MRSNLAQTALRLYPRRCAICAALCPAVQSFFSVARSSASQLMADTYTPLADYRLVGRACVVHAAPAINNFVVHAIHIRGELLVGELQSSEQPSGRPPDRLQAR